MNSIDKQSALRGFGASLWSLLFFVGASQAQANNANASHRQLTDFSSRAQMRAERREARDMQREIRQVRNDVGVSISTTGLSAQSAVSNDRHSHASGNIEFKHRPVPSVSEFRTTRPKHVSNRSTYTTDSGRSRVLNQGVSLDLSSTDANITVGSTLLSGETTTIKVGDETKVITAGSKVTAAEYAALNQALATGSQDLKLNSAGAAVDGSLNLNVVSDNGRTIRTSELVIPTSVEVAGDFGRHADGVRVTNDLVNYGSLYAVSSKQGRDTAVIAARDVDNFAGAVITTNAPDAVAQQLGSKNENLSLAIRADRNLNNAGEISSAGNLELSAGGALTNSGLASAQSSVAINCTNVSNSGLVSAGNGNVNISSPVDANLNVNATGGAFSALNGDINIATSVGANQKTDTTLIGGDWYSNKLNITSGDGVVGAKVGDVTGQVNITSGIISFNADAATLNTGVMNASGDPLISNSGNINLNANIFSSGQPISIVAGGDITASVGISVISSSNNAGAGGEIFIAAGAAFTTNPTNITVTGGTAGGGSVNLPGISQIDSSGDAGAAGNITILAFEGAAGTGKVNLPSADVFATSLFGGGNVKIVAAANSIDGLVVHNVNASGDLNNGGSITLYNAQVNVISPFIINSQPGPNEGQVFPGGGVNPGAFSTGGIIYNSLTTSGPTTIDVITNGNIFSGNVSANSSSNAADITIRTLGSTANVTVSDISTVSTGGSGGFILVSAVNGTVTTGFLQTIGSNGTGNVQALSSGPVTVGGALADGSFGSSGTIGLGSDSNLTINGDLATRGDQAGDITLQAIATLQIADGVTISANGGSSAGDIALFGDSIVFSGAVLLRNYLLAQNGNISLNAGSGSFTLNGDFRIQAGNNISVITPTQTITNNVGGFIDWFAANGNIDTLGVNGSDIALQTNSSAGGIALKAINGSVKVGNLTMLSTSNASASFLTVQATTIDKLGTINTNSAFLDGAVDIETFNNSGYTPPVITSGSGDVIVYLHGSGDINLVNTLTAGTMTLHATNGNVSIVTSPTVSGAVLSALSGTVDFGSISSLIMQPTPSGSGSLIDIRANSITTTSPTFQLSTGSGSGDGGSIYVEAVSVNTQFAANAHGATNGGTIEFNMTNITPQLDLGSLDATGDNGNAGSIKVSNTGGNIYFHGPLSAGGTANGGLVDIDTNIDVYFISAANVFTSGGTSGTAPRIEINANQINLSAAAGSTNSFTADGAQQSLQGIILTTNNIGGASQTLQMSSSSDIRILGNINLTGVAANGGNLSLDADLAVFIPSIKTVTVSGINLNAAGTVSVSAGTDLTIGTINSTVQFGAGGAVSLTAGTGSLSSGPITTSGANGSGQVGLTAQTTLAVGDINTSPTTGSAANVILSAGTNLTAGNINASGGVGGNVNASSLSGSVSVGTVNTSSSVSTAGNVTLDAATNVTALTISANGVASGGTVFIDGSGAMNLTSINSSAIAGAAGNILIQNINGSLTSFAIFTTLDAHSAGGAGGTVSVQSPLSPLQGLDTVNATGVTTNGSISIIADDIMTLGAFHLDASNSLGGGGGSITVTTGANGGVTTDGGSVSIVAVNVVDLTIGTGGINSDGQTVTIRSITGDVNASSANILATNANVFVQANGSLAIGAINAGTGDVTLTSGTTLTTGGTIIGDVLSITFTTGDASLTTNVNSLNYNAAGNLVTVSQPLGNLAISGTANQLDVTLSGLGTRLAVGTLTGHTDVNLRADGNGGGMDFNQSLNVGATGVISLRTINGTITQAVGTSLTAQDLTINQIGGGTASLTNTNNIAHLNCSGTGTINFNNGANPFNIVGLGLSQNLIATTSSALGITLDNNLSNTFGTLDLTADHFAISADVISSSISLSSFSGDLTIDATAGSSLTGTTPTAGTPGNPSTPAAIQISTGVGQDLTLNGQLSLTGDVFIDNTGGTTTSSNNSLFAGTNNITLKTSDWVLVGNGNITANLLILDLPFSGTVINTGGDVTLSSNITFLGQDVAILASGNIIITGNVTFDLSNGAGNGGDLLMVAGWNLTPATTPQQNSPLQYTFTTPNAGGGNINAPNLTIVTQATGGLNGSVTAIANGGSVTLGSLDAQGASSGGTVLLVGEDGVSVGSIDATSVTISASVPVLNGATVTVQNGTLSGGSFQAGATPTAGPIVAGAINSGGGDIKITSAANITINDGLVARGIDIETTGNVSLVDFNSIVTQTTGLPGSINIEANDLTSNLSGPISLVGVSALAGGGFIRLIRAASTPISIGNTYTFNTGTGAGGYVEVANTGDITVEDGSITSGGSNGNGKTIKFQTENVLTLNTSANFFDVDAQGSGNGGVVSLIAQTISVPGGALDISANGAGTGSGGSITYITGDTTATFIGTPTKAPKPPFNTLTLSAVAGGGGGDGGAIDVSVGGNLTANPASMDASASSTGSNKGATYKLTAIGSLVVSGDLDASGTGSGDGGEVYLDSSSKKAFSFGTGKLPKSGVQGEISVGGTNGKLTVINRGGGVLVGQKVNVENVVLTASSKGTIASSGGQSIQSDVLTLTSDIGAIGKKPLITDAGELIVTSNGAVNIDSQFTGNLLVQNSTAGKGGFTLTTAGTTVLSGLDVTGGNIAITSIDDITVVAGGVVQAIDGSIVLNNTSTAGSIVIGATGVVATDGNKGGSVTIAIGEVPKKGVNRLPDNSPTLTVTEVGKKGLAFYDGTVGGLQVLGTGNLVIAENKQVLLSNPNTGSGVISLGGGAIIHADPPARAISNALPMDAIRSAGVTTELQPETARPVQSSIASSSSSSLSDSFATISQIGLSNNALVSSTLQGTTGSVTNGQGSFGEFGALSQTILSAQEIASGNEPAQDLLVDAAFVNDKQTHHVLKNGKVVFAPQSDITVETPHGTLKIAAHSITIVTQSEAGLSIYNVDDHSRNAVVLNTHGKQISLTPGQHVTVSNHRSEQYAEINPIELVQHRGLKKSSLKNGWKFYTSEFSITSACFAVKPLRELAGSKHKEAVKMRNHLMKTAAVIMMLRPDQGDFIQHFKPYTTAMK